MVSGLRLQVAGASAGAAATLAQGRVGRDGHRVRHRGDAVPAAAVRHHVGVSVLLRQLQPSRTRSGRQRARIRTGQLQTAQGAYYRRRPRTRDKKTAFKNALCAAAPTFLDCASKAVVIVQSNANFSSISQPSCTNNGNDNQRQRRRLQHRGGQLGGAGHGLLPLEPRRQVAALQHGQPEGRIAADAGFGRVPFGALQLTPASRDAARTPIDREQHAISCQSAYSAARSAGSRGAARPIPRAWPPSSSP